MAQTAAWVRQARNCATWMVCLLGAGLSACGARPEGDEPVGFVSEELCRAVSLVSDAPGDRAVRGTVVTWTASASCRHKHREFEFWIRASHQPWKLVQPYTAANSFVWDSARFEAGTYEWQVRAREAGARHAYGAVATRSFTLSQVETCRRLFSTASPAGQTSVGEHVRLQGSADCAPSTPSLEFWHRAAASWWWERLQRYSAAATYDWDTSGASAGTHFFQLWARAEGSAAAYDVRTEFSYELQTPCLTLDARFEPPESASSGDQISLTAQASCGGTPEYQVRLLPVGGVWSVVRDWSPDGAFSWDTSGAGAGDYEFEIRARNQGATRAYEASLFSSYRLNEPACSDGSLVAAPTSPSLVGTLVEFAAAANCRSPNYEFLLRPPGGSWAVVQGFGPSNTFAWDTTAQGAGTYGFEMRVRANGASDAYQSRAALDYELYLPAPACGDGHLDPGESCDGANLGGATCADLTAGARIFSSPACTAACTLDSGTCLAPPGCLKESYVIPIAINTRYGSQCGNFATDRVGTAGVSLFYAMPQGWLVNVSGVDQAGPYALLDSSPLFDAHTPDYSVHVPFIGFHADCETGSVSINGVWGTSPDDCWIIHFQGQLPACSGLSTTLVPAAGSSVGTHVTLTAQASCIGTPEYEVVAHAPDGTASVLRPFGTASTFDWDTLGAKAGDYQIEVRARAQGTLDTTSNVVPYRLSAGPCVAATLSAAPLASAQIGTRVELSASARCAQASYQFLVLPPNGDWQVVRDWSSDGLFAWDTTSYAAGVYSFELRARTSDAAVEYETLALLGYELVDPTAGCGDARLDPGEDCDGSVPAGANCESATGGSRAFGVIACTGTCRFDTSACLALPGCMQAHSEVPVTIQNVIFGSHCQVGTRINSAGLAQVDLTHDLAGWWVTLGGIDAAGTYPLVATADGFGLGGSAPASISLSFQVRCAPPPDSGGSLLLQSVYFPPPCANYTRLTSGSIAY